MNLSNSSNGSNCEENCHGSFLEAALLPSDPSAKPSVICALIANIITCPFIIFLNVLVMVAVQIKQELKINSNVVLACLAFTDLLVGIVVQPFYIAFIIYVLMRKEALLSCTLQKLFVAFFVTLNHSSLYNLVLLSGERYLAIKRTFSYQWRVSKAHIIAGSVFAWTLALITFSVAFLDMEVLHFANASVSIFTRVLSVLLITYCHVTVYYEVHRHEKQIAQQQVSMEDKMKIRKEKRALKTTSIIIGTLIFCNAPTLVLLIPYSVGDVTAHLPIVSPIGTTIIMLNSLCNPIIYTVRNRHFREAFITLLTRKNISQAEETRNAGMKGLEVVARQSREDEPEEPAEQRNENRTENTYKNTKGKQ